VAQTDPQDTLRGKFDLGVAGHDDRPDIVTRMVNTGASPGGAFPAPDMPIQENDL
jgi:hypothetical protein